jgi:hypothetical protein
MWVHRLVGVHKLNGLPPDISAASGWSGTCFLVRSMRIATSKPLRAHNLNASELNKAAGGRGTCCGIFMHCGNCGTLNMEMLSLYSNADPSCLSGTPCAWCGAML